MRSRLSVPLLLFLCAFGHSPARAAAPSPRAAWMRSGQWGVMSHYLADWRARVDGEPASVAHWNDLIDHFNVEALADQVKSVGAGWFLISIGQNSGYYLAPNPTYDRLTGITPSKCSRRDLVSDLADALAKRGIRLMVYLPSGAPGEDAAAVAALHYSRGAHRNAEFQRDWEAIIRDWSLRWGTKVSGWWFDGCYWPSTMYRAAEPPNFASFASAARAGNPRAAVAFNPGVVYRTISLTPEEDYTAGEIDLPDRWKPIRNFDGVIDGDQIHVLSFLGQRWGMGAPRFSADEAVAFTRRVAAQQGVITWDTPIQKDGTYAPEFLAQLKAIGDAERAGAAEPYGAAPSKPWMDPTLAPEVRARLLVRQMTLDEKITQIHLTATRNHPREVAGIPRLGIPMFKITNGPAGAGPGDDRPTQPGTALPAGLALAASWDPALAASFGAVAGQEVAERGEDLIEGPGVNIARVPQNGRNFEYFGEDPYLAGRMAVAEIQAIQRQNVIAEVKHFAANSQEYQRKTINEIIDERTLREIYLPAFEAAIVEGGAGAVMAAYPSVNGHFCCENPPLLADILRGDWGFAGFVQSDATATRSAVDSGLAGLDLAMQPIHYSAEMKAAVLSGKVPEGKVDQMVARRFTEMFRYGMFDSRREPSPIPARQDGAISREIAAQTAVLLKNEGALLPLDATSVRSIALIGPYAAAAMTGGGGSSQVKPFYSVAPLDGLRAHAGPGVVLTFNDGRDPAQAAALAKRADVAIVMAGNRDSEGRDRTSLALPGGQDALIAAVAAANARTVVVLKTGGAVLMPWLARVPAVLEAWYPGEEDGNAVADVLFGKVNPSGKLPLTFPKTEAEVPASTPEQYPGVNGNAVYSEKLLVGYRWYDAKAVEPLFPFGFGLSYTTFAFSHLKVQSGPGGLATVSVEVTNTGARPGADVVQVYVADPAAADEPPRQLKAFAKVALAPGQTQRVMLTLDRRAFSIWDVARHGWRVVPGAYGIQVGDSSRNLPLRTSLEEPAS